MKVPQAQKAQHTYYRCKAYCVWCK